MGSASHVPLRLSPSSLLRPVCVLAALPSLYRGDMSSQFWLRQIVISLAGLTAALLLIGGGIIAALVHWYILASICSILAVLFSVVIIISIAQATNP